MNGFGYRAFKTTVKHLEPPTVYVSPRAMKDMASLVDVCDDEVGWLGTVAVTEEQDFIVNEIFLPKQKVHQTTTEIDEGFAELAQQLMTEREDGIEVVNAIRFWGHSHVRMDVGPSHQDEKQLRQLSKDAEGFFLAARANKQGDLRFDILYDDGIQIDDLPWRMLVEAEDRTEQWKEQVKDKVSKLDMWQSPAGGRNPWTNNGAVVPADFGFDDEYGGLYSYPQYGHVIDTLGGDGAKGSTPPGKGVRKLDQEAQMIVDATCDWRNDVDPEDVILCIELCHEVGIPLSEFRPNHLVEKSDTFVDWVGRRRPVEEITGYELEAAGWKVA